MIYVFDMSLEAIRNGGKEENEEEEKIRNLRMCVSVRDDGRMVGCIVHIECHSKSFKCSGSQFYNSVSIFLIHIYHIQYSQFCMITCRYALVNWVFCWKLIRHVNGGRIFFSGTSLLQHLADLYNYYFLNKILLESIWMGKACTTASYSRVSIYLQRIAYPFV